MLTVTEIDGQLLLELDHGKVNALDLDLLNAMIAAFHAAPPEQAVVLSGAGRAFSAGVDLRRIADGGDAYIADFLEALDRCFLAVFDHPGPVVAAINGAAIAGGCVIAAAADRRLIASGPIGLAELAVGVPFPTSALEIMRSVLGPRTSGLVLTARLLDAAEALQAGLVDEIVPAEDLVGRAVEIANQLARLPRGVFTFTKRQLQGPARERITAHTPLDNPAMKELWSSADVREAIDRYMTRLGHS